jgi:hypothetical protein
MRPVLERGNAAEMAPAECHNREMPDEQRDGRRPLRRRQEERQ